MHTVSKSFGRTISQLFDPPFLKVFILGLLTTTVAIGIAWFAANELKGYLVVDYFDSWWLGWLDWTIEWVLKTKLPCLSC